MHRFKQIESFNYFYFKNLSLERIIAANISPTESQIEYSKIYSKTLFAIAFVQASLTHSCEYYVH